MRDTRRPRSLGSTRAFVTAALTGLALVVLMPAMAQAHVERPSHSPDPAPDCSVSPCAGGKVPVARSLASALDDSRPGRTRVVCQADSLDKLRSSVSHARTAGYYVRPTVHRSLSAAQASSLLSTNKALFNRCTFHSIQDAVNASGNNDRVVIMPGLYTEPKSRAKPTNDPACAQYKITNDKGSPGAVSYAYQCNCPNDQNLIAVLGRELGTRQAPQPPLEDRHGIPNLGRRASAATCRSRARASAPTT